MAIQIRRRSGQVKGLQSCQQHAGRRRAKCTEASSHRQPRCSRGAQAAAPAGRQC